MIEDELRAAFARREELVPDPGPLRTAIDRAAAMRRRRRLGVRATGAGAALLALTGLTATALPQGPERVPPPVVAATPAPSPIPAGPLNLLLVGTDRAGPAGRTDTVMIAHVPASRDRAYLISLPRDLVVTLPQAPAVRESGPVKLNQVYEIGSRAGGAVAGLQLAGRAVTALTGLPVDAAGAVDLSALAAVTDAVGGVEMCLPVKVRSVHTGRAYPAGCHTYGGAAAADLLRQGSGLRNGLAFREGNARAFLLALAARVTTTGALTDPVRLNRLIRAGGRGLVVSGGADALLRLLSALREVEAQSVVSLSMPAAPVDLPGGGRGMKLTGPATGLLQAMRTGTVDQYLAHHPELYDR